MATKDLTSAILKRLEEGTAEIYSKYQSLIRASGADYDRKLRELDAEYTAAANAASARAKIDLKNTLEKMADSGYVRSGETVQATIAANAARSGALNDLSVQKAKDKNALESQKAATEAEYSMKAQSEAGEFRNEMLEAARDQANEDRAYEAQMAQQAFENRIANEKLALEKAQSAASAAKTSSNQEEGIVPEKSAYEYLDEIVERNTKNYPKKGYSVVDRKAILQAISMIVQDTNLSLQYRYELYLYGKSLGYIQS